MSFGWNGTNQPMSFGHYALYIYFMLLTYQNMSETMYSLFSSTITQFSYRILLFVDFKLCCIIEVICQEFVSKLNWVGIRRYNSHHHCHFQPPLKSGQRKLFKSYLKVVSHMSIFTNKKDHTRWQIWIGELVHWLKQLYMFYGSNFSPNIYIF